MITERILPSNKLRLVHAVSGRDKVKLVLGVQEHLADATRVKRTWQRVLERRLVDWLSMNEEEWDELSRRLRRRDNPNVAVAAAQELHKVATQDDLPRLIELLNDEDFFIREAAAWPVSELAGPDSLEKLLVAYQAGLDEGHDNDGFTAALINLVESHPEGSRESFRLSPNLAIWQDPKMRYGCCNFAAFVNPRLDHLNVMSPVLLSDSRIRQESTAQCLQLMSVSGRIVGNPSHFRLATGCASYGRHEWTAALCCEPGSIVRHRPSLCLVPLSSFLVRPGEGLSRHLETGPSPGKLVFRDSLEPVEDRFVH